MSNTLLDIRIGLRLLLRTRGLTAVAVMTVAVGIASTTAIFSVVYATFFEPLPYRDPDRLVMVWARTESVRNRVSAGAFTEWRRHADIFEDLNAWTTSTVTVSGGERPEQIRTGRATPGLLRMWGYGHPLALGRDFLDEEGSPGRDQVVVLTHRFWRDRFGADPQVVGRVLRLDRKPYPSTVTSPPARSRSSRSGSAASRQRPRPGTASSGSTAGDALGSGYTQPSRRWGCARRNLTGCGTSTPRSFACWTEHAPMCTP
jgi:hypothetical protein